MYCDEQRPVAGFSLVEIMVVLVIIGLLAGVVTLNVRSYLATAKLNTARAEIATICDALESFYSLNSRYPSADEGLDALARAAESMPEPLLRHLAKDPWGRPYQYVIPGRNDPYEVICFGADGREGGDGGNADIHSAELGDKR